MTAPQKTLRWVEMILLFVGGPTLLWQFPGILGGSRLFIFLWVVGLLCGVGLFFDQKFDRTKLWNAKAVMPAMGWIVGRWLICCILLTAFFGLLSGRELPGLSLAVPTGLFSIFHREGLPWFLPVLITLFYPWVSVYPQNLLCRAFFCQRYRPILGGGWGLILVNAVAFSYIHIMFNNWVVLLLTFVGGILFTRTYLISRRCCWQPSNMLCTGCSVSTSASACSCSTARRGDREHGLAGDAQRPVRSICHEYGTLRVTR